MQDETMRLYVTGLAYSIDSVALQGLFASYGIVMEANVVGDEQSGRSQGFGFVQMPDISQAQKAIRALGGKMVNGRILKVQEAR